MEIKIIDFMGSLCLGGRQIHTNERVVWEELDLVYLSLLTPQEILYHYNR